MDKRIQNLLRIIKITPPLLILSCSIFLITLMYYEEKKELIIEQEMIEKQFILEEKVHMVEHVSTVFNHIKDEQKNIEIELKKKLKYDVDNVYKIINSIYKRNINKKSEDEIIEEIKIALKDIRFNKGRTYIALSNMKSTFVLQPLRPERERKNIYNYQDSRGKYIMHEVIDIANNPKGEGFIEYYFNKLTDTKKEHKKISYIKLFKELGLIIIVGDYLDAFKIDIQQKVLNYIQKFRYKNDAYLFMLDSKGNVLYYPSKEAINHNIFKEKEFSYMSNYYKDLILKKGMMQKLLYPLIQK